MSIHSKYKFTQLTRFERTLREASRSYLLPVHGSTVVQLHRRRIVHQSSDQVCVPRHNIVVLSPRFASLSLSVVPFPDKEENRPRSTMGVNQCDSILFSFLLLASSPFHLRRTSSNPLFLSYFNFSRHRPFLPHPSHPDPFFPSSIRFGDNNRRTNGANLQSRLANGRSRGARYFCQMGQKKKRSFHVCP